MPVISNLKVMLTANSRGFRAGLAKAADKLELFATKAQAQAKRIAGSITKVILGLTAAVSAAITAVTAKAFKDIDKLSKVADKLDVTTESLAALSFQAGLAGTEFATVQKGMQTLGKRMEEAKEGLSEATRGFRMLGISVDDIKGLGIDQTMELVADRLKDTESASVRAAASMALFGRAGMDMQNMLLDGSEGMRKAREEARALGLTFDRVAGRQVEQANDALERLWAVVQGFGRTLAVKLAPIVTTVAQKIQGWLQQMGGAESVIKKVVKFTIRAFMEIKNFFMALEVNLKAFVNKSVILVSSIYNKIIDMVRYTNDINIFGGFLSDEQVERMDRFQKGLKWFTKAKQDAQDKLEADYLAFDTAKETEKVMAKISAWYEEQRKAAAATLKTQEKQVEVQRKQMKSGFFSKAMGLAKEVPTFAKILKANVKNAVVGGLKALANVKTKVALPDVSFRATGSFRASAAAAEGTKQTIKIAQQQLRELMAIRESVEEGPRAA